MIPPKKKPYDPNSLTSERYAEFMEALDVLYIKDNISGRNQFTAAWPDAAKRVFGEELMKYDREGASDRERRTVLEAEADDRRLALLETAGMIEKKSVFEGALQIEYVQGVINDLGRPLALNIYGRKIVDRFIPPAAGEAPAPEPVKEEAPPPVEEKKMATPWADAERMDKIRPISVERDFGPVPQDEPEEDKPLFVAGAFEAGGDNMMPPKSTEPELVIETQGGDGIAIPNTEQQSLAPVVGSAQKKSGLKILGISEEPEDKS